jgi:hypothetical protein
MEQLSQDPKNGRRLFFVVFSYIADKIGPKYYPATYALILVGNVYLVMWLCVAVLPIIGINISFDFDNLTDLAGPVLLGELLRGHLEVRFECSMTKPCWSIFAFVGALTFTLMWYLVEIRWNDLILWHLGVAATCGAGVYMLVGGSFHREHMKKANSDARDRVAKIREK